MTTIRTMARKSLRARFEVFPAGARRMLACGFGAALAFALATPAAAQRDWNAIEIKTTTVAGAISMIQGAGGNIGVCAGADGVFLVDDQFAPLTERIIAAVAKISDRPIRFVLNTHWHGDHTGGNENFGKAGVPIFAHDNVRKTMSAAQISAMGQETPASPKDALPLVTFSDTVSFHMNGETVRVLHVPPAHTDGDAVVHFQNANVIHTGDVVFMGRYPVIDGRHGGSLDGMIAGAGRVIEMCDEKTRVIPGHGALTDREGVRAFRDMLIEVRKRLTPLAAAGKSLDEVKAALPLADLDPVWGGERGSAGFLEMAYPTVKAAGSRAR